MSVMEPTVDTVVAQPVPVFWYYVLAGVGAVMLLVTVTVVVILCCHRYHRAAKTTGSGHHHSVAYHSSPHPNLPAQQNCYQNTNLSYNLIHSPKQNQLYPGAGQAFDPMMTIRLDKDNSYDSQC